MHADVHMRQSVFWEYVAIGVIIDQSDTAEGIWAWFDHSIESIAFRLELVKNDNGTESIRWHGIVDEAPEIFHVDPYTGFWRRLGIGILGLLPIESQLWAAIHHSNE